MVISAPVKGEAPNTEYIEPVIEEITTPTPEPEPQRVYLGEYQIYFYCSCKSCCGKDNGITASGIQAQEGITVASDLPFGTVLYIEGVGVRIVQDRGVSGKKVDVFVGSHNEAIRRGTFKAKVYKLNK